MQLIDGHRVANRIKDEIVKDILKLNKQSGDLKQGKSNTPHRPNLAIILINSRNDSHIYVNLKEKEAQKVGIDTHLYKCRTDISTEEVVEMIRYLNGDPEIDGIFVQLPLPGSLDTDKIINSIDPQKDVDGFHQKNLKRLQEASSSNSLILPPVFQSVSEVLEEIDIQLLGKKICIVANSSIFKNNLSLFLEKERAKVTVSGLEDDNLMKKTQEADIVIIAVGSPGYLKGKMIKENSVLIDLGITKENNKICGDVDQKSVEKKASYLTPVPKGTGPITVAATLKNTLELYKKKLKKQ